jgi:hypothetical protein
MTAGNSTEILIIFVTRLCAFETWRYSLRRRFIACSSVFSLMRRFHGVLSDVSRIRPPQFPCILKLQTPGCSKNSLTFNKNIRCPKPEYHSVLVKRPFVGLTALMPRRHIVLLPERVPSFISRAAAHTKRCERPLLAKEGTISEFS